MNNFKWILSLLFISIFNTNFVASGGKFRIVGGNATTIEKHPWMVSIQFLRVPFCGGSIVSEDVIITAAHCFDEEDNAITIKAGTTDLNDEGTIIRVQSIKIHEHYDLNTYDYDIAIVKLNETLNFSEKIQPIFIPDVESEIILDDASVVTSGWGITEAETASDTLLEVEVYIVNWEICKQRLAHDNAVTDRMICAGYSKGGRDTCQGDSGGALELNGTLIGIVSWGHGCGEADYPGVYTHVGRFRSWIKQHAGV